MENDIAILLQPTSRSNWAFEPILHERFNILKARLFNLADSIDPHRSKAVKGLMKDFVNAAYYDSLRAMEDFLREKNVISQGEGQSGYMGLNARSLDDIHVPEAA
jgi:hypothetical protein